VRRIGHANLLFGSELDKVALSGNSAGNRVPGKCFSALSILEYYKVDDKDK
jgi:hypothetical protein